MKVRLLKPYKKHEKGEVITVRSREGLDLVSRGVAKIDRMYDMGETK